MTADITLRGPGDVVGLLPYQLGYHPRDSVVVVSLRGKRVGLVARADLPPDEHVDEVVSTLLGPLVRDAATSVIVVGYEDVPDASQPLLTALVEQLERAGIHVLDVPVVRDGRRYSATCSDSCCPPEGIALPDPADVPGVAEYVGMGRAPLRSRGAVHGLVEPERWRCEGVSDAVAARSRMRRLRRRSAVAWAKVLAVGEAGSRPPDRTVVADVALGLADVPWRDGLIAWLAPTLLCADSIEGEVVQLLRSSLPTWAGMGLAPEPSPLGLVPGPSVAGASPVGPVPRPMSPAPGTVGPAPGTVGPVAGTVGPVPEASPPGLVRGTGSGARVTDPGRRPRAAETVDSDVLSMERDELLHRLLALCRSVPDECAVEAAALCTVAAHVAWIGGDGAIARVAVDRAVRLVPDYRLARLLERLIDLGLRLPPVTGRERGPGALGRVG